MADFHTFLSNNPDREKKDGSLQPQSYSESTVDQYVKITESYEDGRLNTECISRSRWLIVTSALKAYRDFQTDKKKKKAIASVIKGMRKPPTKQKDAEDPLTKEEFNKLFKCFSKQEFPLRNILQMLAYSGLRVKDIARIERIEVKRAQQKGFLRYTKKRGGRGTTPFSGGVSDYLLPLLKEKNWKIVQDLISTSYWNFYMQLYTNTKRCAKKVIKRDSEKVHPHLFRRTIAHMLHEQGKDIEFIRQFLEHSEIATTQKYINKKNMDMHRQFMEDLDKERFGK